MSAQIDYPIDYVQLVVGKQVFHYIHRTVLQDRNLLQDLRLDLVQGNVLGIDADLPITVILLPWDRGEPPNLDDEDDD